MTVIDAWNSCIHGGFITRPSGMRIEKWMGEKPNMKPSFDRWLDENVSLISASDLIAGDWIVGT